MNSKRKIYAIFPAPILGGHEVMAARILNKIIATLKFNVLLVAPEKNARLKSLISGAGLVEIKYNMRKLESFFWFFNLAKLLIVFRLLRKIKKENSIIFLVQGSIEHGLDFIWIGKLVGVPVISYLPMTHSFSEMRFKMASLRDVLGEITYKMCSKYVVISTTSVSDIKRYNNASEVILVKNFIEDEIFNSKRLCPATGKINIFLVGRVSFGQKGQNLFLKALKTLPDSTTSLFQIHVVGDGPDLSLLREMSKEFDVKFYGWVDKWWDIPSKIDFLFISSLFEGVPLVMLEAIAINVPVIAPNRDGMVDYLASDYLYETGEALIHQAGIAAKLEKIANKSLNLDNKYIVNADSIYSDLDVKHLIHMLEEMLNASDR